MQLRPLLRGHALDDVDARDLLQQGEVAEGRTISRRLSGDVRIRLDEAVGEDAVVVRRQLAADLAPGRRRREAVGLVEEARDRIGPFGVELDGGVRTRPEEEEPQLLGRDDLGDLRGRCAEPLWRSTSSDRRGSGTRTAR